MIDASFQPLAGESSGPADETPGNRLRRLRIRSWRRGTREMDLILGRYADATLALLEPAALDRYEALLAENDVDLYRWIAGADRVPDAHRETVGHIRAHHRLG